MLDQYVTAAVSIMVMRLPGRIHTDGNVTVPSSPSGNFIRYKRKSASEPFLPR